MISCNGYGFPRHRGGPPFYADTIGLPRVLERMRALAAAHGERYWSAPPLLEPLAAQRLSFAAADARCVGHTLGDTVA